MKRPSSEAEAFLEEYEQLCIKHKAYIDFDDWSCPKVTVEPLEPGDLFIPPIGTHLWAEE